MYAREIDGREYTFGVSGKLIRNVLVMYDRQTESLWSQLLGESVRGELIGTKLEFLPSWHTTWGQWKEMHPDTLALKKSFSGNRDGYAGYYRSNATGVIGESIKDDRLAVKEFVIGVELVDEAIAYPFSALSLDPVVNDTVGGHQLLVVFDSENGSGVVFNRQLGDQTLTFTPIPGDPLTLKDDETGTLWNSFNGEAKSGPLTGEQLERVKSTTSFWFGWKDFHTDTLVYGMTPA